MRKGNTENVSSLFFVASEHKIDSHVLFVVRISMLLETFVENVFVPLLMNKRYVSTFC